MPTSRPRSTNKPGVVFQTAEDTPDVAERDFLDKWLSFINWDGVSQWWNDNAWFPRFMGRPSKEGLHTFADFIFWHSFLLTALTPGARWVYGHWRAVIPSIWLLNTVSAMLGFPLGLEGEYYDYRMPVSDVVFPFPNGTKATPFDTRQAQNMDTTWHLHAYAGMAWLVVSWCQIRVFPKKWHPRTGPAALLTLFVHLSMALNILVHDQGQNDALNKVALSSLTFIAATYFLIGAYKAARYLLTNKKDKQAKEDHINRMMIGWLWSISGAGPIRMVAAFTEPFGIGPLRCMDAHGSQSTDCMWPYFNRLVMIATWNLLMTGCFVWIRQDRELTKTWVKNVACHILVCISFGILSYLPGSADYVINITGGAGDVDSAIHTYFGYLVQALQLTIFFPLIFTGLTVFGPAMLIGYIVSACVL